MNKRDGWNHLTEANIRCVHICIIRYTYSSPRPQAKFLRIFNNDCNNVANVTSSFLSYSLRFMRNGREMNRKISCGILIISRILLMNFID